MKKKYSVFFVGCGWKEPTKMSKYHLAIHLASIFSELGIYGINGIFAKYDYHRRCKNLILEIDRHNGTLILKYTTVSGEEKQCLLHRGIYVEKNIKIGGAVEKS